MAVTFGSAYAQTVDERAAEQFRKIESDRAAEERQLQIERRRWQNRIKAKEEPDSQKLESAASDESCIHVSVISAEGITILDKKKISALFAPFEMRCLGLQQINAILKHLTHEYVKRGYVTARAYLPEQDLSDGQLNIVFVEGKLEAIVFDDVPGKFITQIRTAFPGLIGKPINLRDLEQGLEQLNRLSANNATMDIRPGENPGQSILAVNRNRSKRWSVSAGVDNLGSNSTGIYQSRIDIVLEDLVSLNEQISIGYSRSHHNHPFDYVDEVPVGNTVQASISMPYGYWTMTLDGQYGDYTSEIPGTINFIDTSGFNRNAKINLARVLHRNQTSKTYVSTSLNWKQGENFIQGSRLDGSSRTLSIAKAEIVHSRELFAGQLTAQMSYERGLNILDATSNIATAGSGKPQFGKFAFAIDYFKLMSVGRINGSYLGTLSGQWSPDYLVSSEQMSLGGQATVRGLRESVLFGNNVALARNEFSVKAPELKSALIKKILGQFEAYGALDFGHVFRQEQHQIDSGHLAGATLGLRTKGGRLSFDVAYSDLITYSDWLKQDVSESGLFYVKANVAF